MVYQIFYHLYGIVVLIFGYSENSKGTFKALWIFLRELESLDKIFYQVVYLQVMV